MCHACGCAVHEHTFPRHKLQVPTSAYRARGGPFLLHAAKLVGYISAIPVSHNFSIYCRLEDTFVSLVRLFSSTAAAPMRVHKVGQFRSDLQPGMSLIFTMHADCKRNYMYVCMYISSTYEGHSELQAGMSLASYVLSIHSFICTHSIHTHTTNITYGKLSLFYLNLYQIQHNKQDQKDLVLYLTINRTKSIQYFPLNLTCKHT